MTTTELVGKSGNAARGATQRIGDAMRQRRPFANSSRTFKGEPQDPKGTRRHGTGHMPPELAQVFNLAQDQHGVDYIVHSYWTPIAWHDSRGWHTPLTTYSPTTTHHQHMARMGVYYSGMGEDEQPWTPPAPPRRRRTRTAKTAALV